MVKDVWPAARNDDFRWLTSIGFCIVVLVDALHSLSLRACWLEPKNESEIMMRKYSIGLLALVAALILSLGGTSYAQC